MSYRYRHNPATGLCQPFVYGLCGGNANNFSTLSACQDACPGGDPNFDACNVASDCELGPVSDMGDVLRCCPGDTTQTPFLLAFAKRYGATLRGDCSAVTCGVYPPAAETAPTEEERNRVPPGDPLHDNPVLQVPVQVRKYFVPVCRRHECGVLDIRTSSISACTRDSDCKLRDGAECCEGSDGRGIVAIAKGSTLEQLSCAVGQRCAHQASEFPRSLRAQCLNRHCQVVAIPPSWRELTGNGAPSAKP